MIFFIRFKYLESCPHSILSNHSWMTLPRELIGTAAAKVSYKWISSGAQWCIILRLQNKVEQVWRSSLQWRHNGRDCVSSHQPHHCLLSRLFRRRSKKTWRAGHSPVTCEFPVQMASNAENVSIWWRHHGTSHIAAILGATNLTPSCSCQITQSHSISEI